MGSGSREYDFNEMAAMGESMADNQKALDDVRSSFVSPTQEEDAPVPTRVNLEGPASDGKSELDEREKAHMALRRLQEIGHDASDIIMTPANIKKLAEWNDKAGRVEQARQAYEQDPEKYAMDSANALDGYIKSWNLKNLTPEQRTGRGDEYEQMQAANKVGEATAKAASQEVPSMDGNTREGLPMVHRSAGGGEASAPGGQPARSEDGPSHQSAVPQGNSQSASEKKSLTNNGVTTGPNPPEMAQLPKKHMTVGGKDYEVVGAPAGTVKAYTPPENTERGPSRGPSKVAQKNGPQADEPASNNAARAAMAEMIPESVIPLALALGGMKGAKGMADKVETEMLPAAQGMVRKAMSKVGNRGAQAAAQEVNNNISRVAKPPGLAVREGLAAEREALAAQQSARQAQKDRIGYKSPGDKGYKPPTKEEIDRVRAENDLRVAVKKQSADRDELLAQRKSQRRKRRLEGK